MRKIQQLVKTSRLLFHKGTMKFLLSYEPNRAGRIFAVVLVE